MCQSSKIEALLCSSKRLLASFAWRCPNERCLSVAPNQEAASECGVWSTAGQQNVLADKAVILIIKVHVLEHIVVS